MSRQETFLTRELLGMVAGQFELGFPSFLKGSVGVGGSDVDLALPGCPPGLETNQKLPRQLRLL